MASGAIRTKLAVVRFVFDVAVHAGGRGAFVGAARVAAAALQVVVASSKGKKIMLYRAFGERDGERVVQAGRDSLCFVVFRLL